MKFNTYSVWEWGEWMDEVDGEAETEGEHNGKLSYIYVIGW